MKRLLLLLGIVLSFVASGFEANAAPITATSQFNNAKCYTVRTSTRGAWYYNSSSDWFCSTSNTTNPTGSWGNSVTVSSTDTYQQWAFLSYEGNLYAYNVGGQKFMAKDGTMSSTPSDPIFFKACANTSLQGSYPLVAYFDATHYVNFGGNYNVAINSWGANDSEHDEGCSLAIEEAASFTNTAAMAALEAAFGGGGDTPTESSTATITMTYGHGSLSGNTWTSNASSGLAGVTITSSGSSMATNGTSSTSYYYMTPASNTTTYNYTISAPSGWKLKGYSITFKSGRSSSWYYVYGKTGTGVTTSDYTARATSTAQTMSLTGQDAEQLYFSFRNGNSNSSQRVVITAFTIELEKAGIDADVSWSAATGSVDTDTEVSNYPTLNNNSNVVVTYSSSNTAVATINGAGVITPVGPGTTTITASWAQQAVGTQKYLAGSTSYTLTVTGSYAAGLEWRNGTTTVTSYTVRSTAVNPTFPEVYNPNNLTGLTYTSAKPEIATVDANGNVTLVGSGTVKIKVTSPAQTVGSKQFKAGEATYKLTVVYVDPEQGTVETAEGTFFPTLGEQWGNVLNVFYDVNKDGRYYPEDQDWIDHGFNPDDIAFVRSHVRKRERILATTADHSVKSTNYWKQNRTMFYNVPSGVEKGYSNGYPSASASDDNFSMWNYVDLFGSWNHGIGHAPGSWTDAAHKNGVNISGGIIFFDDQSGYQSYVNGVRGKDNTEPSGFKYVRAIISMLMYFGQEGISFNYEYGSPGEEDQRAFMTAIYDLAADRGYTADCRFNLYSFNSSYSSDSRYAEWGTKGDGRVTDIMLNYASSDFTSQAAASKTNFANQVGDEYADRIYAGVWIVSMARTYSRLSGNDVGIALWGEHNASRFWTYNTGNTPQEFMENYVELLENGFSGANRNPNNTPTVQDNNTSADWGNRLAGFHGMASFMAERSSVVGDLPFQTHFQLGNGFRYNYKGKKTGGAWYNMATQDIVPTYRWLVVNDASASTKVTNTSIVPRFSFDDAFLGGTMLKITGAGSTAGDIVLFKSNITPSAGNVIAKIAVKTPDGAGATNMQLKLQVNGTWKTYPVGSTEGTTWEEKTIKLSDISAGDVIQNIALRMTTVNTATKIYVGKLELNDDCKATPFGVKNLQAKIYNEKKTSMSIKAWWEIDKEADIYGHVYNDELNIDHFELFYKPFEAGDVVEVSRSSQWATLAPNIVVGENDDPWIGVRSVSTDLKTYSDVVWIHVGHNLDASGNLYGDGYGYPTLSSYGSGGNESDWIQYVKLMTAYTEGASVQNIDYDISSNAPDPYVGSTNPNCPPINLAGAELPANILADITAYETADQYCLKVNPGDNIDFYFTHQDQQGGNSLSYGILSVFADWYGLGNYADDPTYSIGTPRQKQTVAPYYQSGIGTANCLRYFNFTVPDDAKPGKSHLRLVFNDAWSGQPGPTQATTKGWAIDFPMEVMDIGQTVGISPSEVGKDQGQAATPEGLPGAPVSTWSNILDGTAYYITDYTTSSAPVVLYNNNGDLTGVASTGTAQESLDDGNVQDLYNTRFVARRQGDQIMFVNGHGEYLGTADLTVDYSSSENEGTAVDGNIVGNNRLIYINGRPMLLESASYPQSVTLRPTQCITIEGITDLIGVATWSAPYETVLPDGIEAYGINTNDDRFGYLEKLELTNAAGDRVVPANAGVLLVTVNPDLPETGLTYQMVPAKSSAATDAASNSMGAQTAKTYDLNVAPPSLYYILGAKDGTSATRKLYRAKNSGNKLGANKAYLIPAATSASSLSLVFKGGATGIGRVVEGIDPEAPAYDLQGRRISKDGFKGVYIQNGRKVVKF